jgi:hypothetical protein
MRATSIQRSRVISRINMCRPVSVEGGGVEWAGVFIEVPWRIT